MEAVELKNIAGGALQAKFNKAMEAVVANLLDPNTPSKDKRKITIEMTFVTDEERTQVASTVSVKQKLAPLHPINTQFGIGKDLKDGGNFIEEYGQHLPGQIKVVKIDKATMDYYIRLTEFHKQFQAVGNNYNQVVRALKNNFGEKRAMALLYKLERLSLELMLICKKVMALTQEYERKWLQK